MEARQPKQSDSVPSGLLAVAVARTTKEVQ